MQKLIIRLISKLFYSLSDYARRNGTQVWDDFILKAYQLVRQKESFVLNREIIEVKKGRVKYTLFVIETRTQGNVKYNLGRYDKNHTTNVDSQHIAELVTAMVLNKTLKGLDLALS